MLHNIEFHYVLSSITETPQICMLTAFPHHQGGRAFVHWLLQISHLCFATVSRFGDMGQTSRHCVIEPKSEALAIMRAFDIFLRRSGIWRSERVRVRANVCMCFVESNSGVPEEEDRSSPKQPFLALDLVRRTKAQLNPRANIVCRSACAFAHQPPRQTSGP